MLKGAAWPWPMDFMCACMGALILCLLAIGKKVCLIGILRLSYKGQQYLSSPCNKQMMLAS